MEAYETKTLRMLEELILFEGVSPKIKGHVNWMLKHTATIFSKSAKSLDEIRRYLEIFRDDLIKLKRHEVAGIEGDLEEAEWGQRSEDLKDQYRASHQLYLIAYITSVLLCLQLDQPFTEIIRKLELYEDLVWAASDSDEDVMEEDDRVTLGNRVSSCLFSVDNYEPTGALDICKILEDWEIEGARQNFSHCANLGDIFDIDKLKKRHSWNLWQVMSLAPNQGLSLLLYRKIQNEITFVSSGICFGANGEHLSTSPIDLSKIQGYSPFYVPPIFIEPYCTAADLLKEFPRRLYCSHIELDFCDDSDLYQRLNCDRNTSSIGIGMHTQVCYGKYFNEEVAVKIVRNQNVSYLRFLQREIDILTRLRLSPVDCSTAVNEILMVIKYGIIFKLCKLGNLENFLSYYQKSLSMHQRLEFLKDLIDAYSLLHAAKLLHRDVKASNVLVGDDGKLKLCDFGHAKFEDEKEPRPYGCLLFQSPKILQRELEREEALESSPTDCYNSKDEAYSFGLLAYHVLTSKRPFASHGSLESQAEKLSFFQKVVKGKRPVLPFYLDKKQKDFLDKAWTSDEESRSSFEQMRVSLLSPSPT